MVVEAEMALGWDREGGVRTRRSRAVGKENLVSGSTAVDGGEGEAVGSGNDEDKGRREEKEGQRDIERGEETFGGDRDGDRGRRGRVK